MYKVFPQVAFIGLFSLLKVVHGLPCQYISPHYDPITESTETANRSSGIVSDLYRRMQPFNATDPNLSEVAEALEDPGGCVNDLDCEASQPNFLLIVADILLRRFWSAI